MEQIRNISSHNPQNVHLGTTWGCVKARELFLEAFKLFDKEEVHFELHECNHGIDGHDARFKLAGTFTTRDKAMKWLEKRGYTHLEYGSYAHKEENQRYCMGKIDYTIKEVPKAILLDPE